MSPVLGPASLRVREWEGASCDLVQHVAGKVFGAFGGNRRERSALIEDTPRSSGVRLLRPFQRLQLRIVDSHRKPWRKTWQELLVAYDNWKPCIWKNSALFELCQLSVLQCTCAGNLAFKLQGSIFGEPLLRFKQCGFNSCEIVPHRLV